MTYTTTYQWGPGVTPKVISRLITWTCVITICSALLQALFDHLSIAPGPQDLLGLSWHGMQQWYLWQPITYLFIQSSYQGISFFFLLTLLFSMYLIWVLGSNLVERIGAASFLRFYLFCGIASGVFCLLLMPLTGQYSFLAGPAPSILAIMLAWSMFHPETEILLFFLIPLKAKWVLAFIIAAILLTNLSQGDLVTLSLYISALVFAYLYAVMAWGAQTPFAFTHHFDSYLAKKGDRLFALFSKKLFKHQPSKSKIFDIKTGEAVLDDDQFIDAMLTKISRSGEKSLSKSERTRMQRISDRKMKEKL